MSEEIIALELTKIVYANGIRCSNILDSISVLDFENMVISTYKKALKEVGGK